VSVARFALLSLVTGRLWLCLAFVILLSIVLGGRAHSRYLDAQEALWAIASTPDDISDASVQRRAQSRIEPLVQDEPVTYGSVVDDPLLVPNRAAIEAPPLAGGA
jgi:hypothetical protein